MQPKPFHDGYLPEQEGHSVYFAQYGNPEGEAVVLLHGGPGSCSKPRHAQSYDLERVQVITFDQRGCGESKPAGMLENNNTQRLVQDTERLREYTGIEQWFVAGGSWGSALALAYAQEHPERVRGLLLHALFLARPEEIAWAFQRENGLERLFPDVWERRLRFLERYGATPETAPRILLEAMRGADEGTQKDVAAGVINWESNLLSVTDDVSYKEAEDMDDSAVQSARIFLWYEANNFFLEENQLMCNMKRISRIPAVIVHGRYDVLCPLKQVWELKQWHENIDVVVLPSSGHKLSAEGQVARGLTFNWALERWTG